MPNPDDPSDRQIWTEGFRHGYAGFVIRQSAGDRAYAAGYAAGQELRQVSIHGGTREATPRRRWFTSVSSNLGARTAAVRRRGRSAAERRVG